MNKRIKKKLYKRYGYKKYSNPRINHTIRLTLPDGSKAHYTIPILNIPNRNGRTYSPDLIPKMMKELKNIPYEFTEVKPNPSSSLANYIRETNDISLTPRIQNDRIMSLSISKCGIEHFGGNNE